MATNSITVKNFSQFQGLDKRSSDLTRGDKFSSGMNNASFNKPGAIVKRKGYQYKADSTGGFGIDTYKDTDTTTGAVTETVVTVDDSLYTLVSDSFNVTYSGSGTALLSIEVDTVNDRFHLTIIEDTVSKLDQNLKLGVDESSATAISAVITAIDALTDYAASGGTITTGSAAFLDLKRSVTLTSTATALGYKRWAIANESKANPLATTLTKKNDADFENYSFVNLNNILYIGSGYDELHKYDGQTLYRAGMPAGGDADGSGDAGTAPTTAEDSGSSTHSQNDEFFYFYLHKQIDNKGNIVEGIKSPFSAKETIAAASANVDVTVTNIASTSGFNTNGAIADGAQVGVTTITVDTGHTMKAGDTAFFFDGATSAYVTRVLTSTTTTTIVFAGSVNAADNAIISNNLRIGIYRTTKTAKTTAASLQTYSLVAEIPNDSIGTGTQVFDDAVVDASLGAEFVEPIKAHGLPPIGRYLTAFRNQLFIAGKPTNVNSVSYSDIDNPEFFPAGDNSFLVDAFQGSKIRGISSLDTAVVVFKDRSIQAVTGDIATDSFRVDEISYGGIGCAAHHSIRKISGSLFFLSNKGVFAAGLDGINPIGDRIQTEFTKFDVGFTFQKATSINWVDQDKYVLFMPNEATDGSSNKYADADSKIFAYDYTKDAWLQWNNVNAQGGFALTDSTLYFHARRLDSDSSAAEFPVAVFSNTGNLNDYNDHQEAVCFSYETHWETLGDPQILKKFSRIKVFALRSDVLDGEAPLYTLTVDQEINFITPAPIATFTMDFSGGAGGWGNGGWGNFPWGDSPIPGIRGKLKSTKTRALKLKFSNDVQSEDILISGYELEAVAPYSAAFKE